MSHEIRTPLNAVIGMTELVLKSELSAQQREFLTTVRDSGEALLSVINDILDFSKIEAGKLQLDTTTFDLRESLGNTLKSFAIRAHQQGLELASLIHPDVPHMVVGDYNRLRQVVVNLIGNALKFTEQGEVVLEVCRESYSAQQVALHFKISDTGIGISPEKQATIFGMFEQADGSTTRRLRRHRFGVGDRHAARAADGWAHLGRKRTGARQSLSLHHHAATGGRRAGRAEFSGARQSARTARAGGRRQCHQSANLAGSDRQLADASDGGRAMPTTRCSACVLRTMPENRLIWC